LTFGLISKYNAGNLIVPIGIQYIDQGSATALHFTAGYLKLSLQQEPTPCFAFLGGGSPLPIRSTGAIILS
jgi:hypothetical protein